MYRVLRADKDAYITDRVIRTMRRTGSNTGRCGTLDLFKLYGYSTTLSGTTVLPNVELSRLLVHYDLTDLRTLVSQGKIDVNDSSFACTLKLFDVYGGQPTPANFTVSVFPLSRSFDEGTGRDIVYYADLDACNFLTASWTSGSWYASGCGLGGGVGELVDYLTSSLDAAALEQLQTFATGEEDLSVDVTSIISSTIVNRIPDCGFRISLTSSIENDSQTYFVKRFASRHAYDESKRPRLIVRFDDSIQDDSQSLFLDSRSTLFLRNYVHNTPAHLTSGSSNASITGSNCLILKLSTEISGGTYELWFTGSQHSRGINYVTGVYSASVLLSSIDSTYVSKLFSSSSIKLTPIWGSLDGHVAFHTGSAIYAFPPVRSPDVIDAKEYVVNVLGVEDEYGTSDDVTMRINIFDKSSPLVTVVKTPALLSGVVVRDTHYQIRDATTNLVEVPFDTVKNSTKASSDSKGMYFSFNTSMLTKDRTYVIDVMLLMGDSRHTFKAASPVFRVSDL